MFSAGVFVIAALYLSVANGGILQILKPVKETMGFYDKQSLFEKRQHCSVQVVEPKKLPVCTGQLVQARFRHNEEVLDTEYAIITTASCFGYGSIASRQKYRYLIGKVEVQCGTSEPVFIEVNENNTVVRLDEEYFKDYVQHNIAIVKLGDIERQLMGAGFFGSHIDSRDLPLLNTPIQFAVDPESSCKIATKNAQRKTASAELTPIECWDRTPKHVTCYALKKTDLAALEIESYPHGTFVRAPVSCQYAKSWIVRSLALFCYTEASARSYGYNADNAYTNCVSSPVNASMKFLKAALRYDDDDVQFS